MAPARDKEIRDKYGNYDAIDVSSYIMGHNDEIPSLISCGCKISRNNKAELERCRSEFRHNEQEGKKLYALLGSYANGDAGPLVTARLEDDTVIVIMSPQVAASNPVMEVVDGNVKIRGSRQIVDELRKPLKNPTRLGRLVENISRGGSRFKLVESVKAGVSISINSLRTYDYTLVHPHNRCKITRAELGQDSRYADSARVSSSRRGDSGKHRSTGGDANRGKDRHRRASSVN